MSTDLWSADFVLLSTDLLLWLLTVSGVTYAFYARVRPHLRAPWSRIARSAPGMGAATVLVFFILIALLDSLHFRPRLEGQAADGSPVYASEVRSVLDVLLKDLREKNERTYSAPLATRAYVKETNVLPGGKVMREYPRLRHGGAHLDDPRERDADVLSRIGYGVAFALPAWGLLIALVALPLSFASRKSWPRTLGDMLRGRTAAAWQAVCFTLLALFLLWGPVYVLSAGYHVLGTDKVGQDVLYQALKSIRTGIVIGGVTTLVTLPFGVLLGIVAGYFKGWIDDVVQYVYTVINSIPDVLLIAAAVLMMQVYIDTHPDIFPTTAERADIRLLFLCLILGLTSWTGLARLLRGEAFKLRELEYVQAAHAFGVRHGSVMARHILPNVMHIVLISLVMDFSALVLAEAVLSYIGVGVDPTMNSFGTMINLARLEMAREPMVWWSLATAFVFMFVLVLAANLFADAVRDAFDPRLVLRPKNRLLARGIA
jgi:peptide/nickel transport system permease protein